MKKRSGTRTKGLQSVGAEPAETTVPQGGDRRTRDAFPIVGIGASAGGLEALEQFLQNVPAGSGMAFVVVQHLDPTHKGILVELLQRATTMPVVQVKDRHDGRAGPRLRDPAQQGHVHPARRAAPAAAGRAARAAPADRLLLPLAGGGPAGAQHRRHPLGHGLRRHAGPAGHQGEGRGGLRAGARLGQVRRHAPQRHRRRAGRRRRPGRGAARQDHRLSPARPRASPARRRRWRRRPRARLEKVFILLRTHTGNDFSLYKKSTIYRRIERRMGLHQIDKIATTSASCGRTRRRSSCSSRSSSSA